MILLDQGRYVSGLLYRPDRFIVSRGCLWLWSRRKCLFLCICRGKTSYEKHYKAKDGKTRSSKKTGDLRFLPSRLFLSVVIFLIVVRLWIHTFKLTKRARIELYNSFQLTRWRLEGTSTRTRRTLITTRERGVWFPPLTNWTSTLSRKFRVVTSSIR